MLLYFLIGIGIVYLISKIFMKTALNISVLATGFGSAYYAESLHEGKTYMIITFTIIFAFLIWGLIYFLKGLLIGLKAKKHSFLWMSLFVLLTLFITIPPGLVFGEIFYYVTQNIEIPHHHAWGWAIGLFFAYKAYQQFDFLHDYAPLRVFRFYKAGVNLVV